jgi:hypothetical protein
MMNNATKRIRTISNLTNDQIEQKRSVDRKAQRAFRQRTKDYISELEQKVAELKESSAEQIVQLQQELHTLREHNDTLVRRLESIAALVSATASPQSHVLVGQANELGM